MDAAVRARLLASMEAGRLVILCGAGLSMAPPSSLPSAWSVATNCYDRYVMSIDPACPPGLRGDLEALAEIFARDDTLGSVFIEALVPWESFVRPPNAGHAAVADFLITRMAAGAVSANYDNLIERRAQDYGFDLAASLDGDEATVRARKHAPLLKFHGCSVRERRATVWTASQLTEDAVIAARIAKTKTWMAANLREKDLLVVGFRSDWSYLNAVLAEAMTGVAPLSVTLVDLAGEDVLQAKAPSGGRWPIRGTSASRMPSARSPRSWTNSAGRSPRVTSARCCTPGAPRWRRKRGRRASRPGSIPRPGQRGPLRPSPGRHPQSDDSRHVVQTVVRPAEWISVGHLQVNDLDTAGILRGPDLDAVARLEHRQVDRPADRKTHRHRFHPRFPRWSVLNHERLTGGVHLPHDRGDPGPFGVGPPSVETRIDLFEPDTMMPRDIINPSCSAIRRPQLTHPDDCQRSKYMTKFTLHARLPCFFEIKLPDSFGHTPPLVLIQVKNSSSSLQLQARPLP